jgi:hypothetical protein
MFCIWFKAFVDGSVKYEVRDAQTTPLLPSIPPMKKRMREKRLCIL